MLKAQTAPVVPAAVAAWGEKRSKPMNTLNWEKLPTFKATKTIFATGGASAGLRTLLGEEKQLDLDLAELEGLFARPETKAKPVAAGGEEKPRATKVSLLDAKRSTSVGIVMKRITDALRGHDLRQALMEVDLDLLPLEVLPMVREIVPTAEEKKLLLDYSGDVSNLDKPEQMMRTLAHIPRLEGRLTAMRFMAQLQVDLNGGPNSVLMASLLDVRKACEAIQGSTELHALLQIVLDVGNALNAGTAKGNAIGFKLTTLLKLAELKGNDKRTTLLHYVVDVVNRNAPNISEVVTMQKAVREASRVSLEELQTKSAATSKGMEQVDAEITWHFDQRLREGGSGAGEAGEEEEKTYEDQFPEVFSDFYNWASEEKERFDEELKAATAIFRETCDLLGESGAKEPADLFDILEKFIGRFDLTLKEVAEAKRVAEQAVQAIAAAGAGKVSGRRKVPGNPTPTRLGAVSRFPRFLRKTLTGGGSGGGSGAGGTPAKGPQALTPAGGAASRTVGLPAAADLPAGIPQRRLSSTGVSRKSIAGKSELDQLTAEFNSSVAGALGGKKTRPSTAS